MIDSGTPTVNALDLRGGSALERDFALRWATLRGAPALRREFCFLPARKWRFDFAHPEARVGIELDGGIWRGARGGHTSGTGASRDREKDFSAVISGWSVFRLTPEMAKDRARLEAIADFIRSRIDPYHIPSAPQP